MSIIKKSAVLLIFMCTQIVVSAQSPYIDSLKLQLSTAAEDTNKVIALEKLSNEYVWTFADTGKAFAEQGLQLAKTIGYKYGEAQCSYNLCICLSQQGNFTNALDFGFRALSIFESLADTANMSHCHGVLMICYRDQGDYKQALIQGFKAKELMHADPSNVVIIIGNISSVYEKMNRLDSALYYGQQAYQLDEHWPGLLITLGNVYSKMGDQKTALSYYEKGLTDGRSNWSSMDIWLGKSKVFELTGKMDSSIYSAQRSFFMGQEIKNPRGTLDASKQLAHLFELRNQPDSTIKYLKLTNTLNDSLFSDQKTREAQGFAFNEKLHRQELQSQQLINLGKFRMYGLLGLAFVFLLLALIQYRNSKHRQQANIHLQEQKLKVESSLAELKAAQAQLIQSEKMAGLGQLTAGIAHEIQNPLNFVNNFSDINREMIAEMKEEIDKGNYEEVKNIADSIHNNEAKINQHGKRADAIVKGMLQHSHTNASQRELTDINALADEYLRLSYHGLRAKDKSFNVTMHTDFDQQIGKINIIPQDIGRVLLNVYNNAFYTARPPNPRREGKEEPDDKHIPTVWVSTKKVSDKVLISVRDNGSGIPKNIINKIFQPFFTTKPTGQGTGLGLSLSYDIVKAHGGEITVKTEEGAGSEFIIQIPIL